MDIKNEMCIRDRVSGRGTSDDYSDADSTFDRYV